jgi:hypothetical protein
VATRPVDKAFLKIHCIEKMTISIEVKPDPQLAALSTVFVLFLFRDVVVCTVSAIRDAAPLGTRLRWVIYR